jgi:hypothetical protein
MNTRNLRRNAAAGIDQRLKTRYLTIQVDPHCRDFDNAVVYRTHAGRFNVEHRKGSELMPFSGRHIFLSAFNSLNQQHLFYLSPEK